MNKKDHDMDEWERRHKNHEPAQSKEERQWRSRKRHKCASCANMIKEGFIHCRKCHDKYMAVGERISALEDCYSVEELKQFIREHLL